MTVFRSCSSLLCLLISLASLLGRSGGGAFAKFPSNRDGAFRRLMITRQHASGGKDTTSMIDTTSYQEHEEDVFRWLESLQEVERSEPEWIQGSDIRRGSLSPSLLIQEHLDSLYSVAGNKAPQLFPTPASRAKFDFEWRYALLTMLPDADVKTILKQGQSHSHPLRLQLVACPPGKDFPLHAHASVELDIPLIGDLYERRSKSHISPEQLIRRPEHEVGALGGSFRVKPTPSNLQIIARDLKSRVILEDRGEMGAFVDRMVPQGKALVNEVGSVHQSYTGDDRGCLLFVLGENVHAHFQPGNFRQRTGIATLRGIDDLLVHNRQDGEK